MDAVHDRMGANVLGSHIDAVGWGDCLDRIFGWASRHESRYVCMCNVHSVVTARRERAFGAVINAADLAPPDGAPIAWRLRSLGYSGQPRISGPDLMWKCCGRAAAQGLPVFLYGGTAEVLRRLSARIAREFPGMQLAGCYAPPFRPLTPEEDTLVVRAINESGAAIVLVALGCPKQEAWIAEHRGRINAVMIGVGAAFNFYAGVTPRAPRWLRDAGLEWLYRLSTEPRRLWRRYLVTNTLFLAYLAAETLGPDHGRKSPAQYPEMPESSPEVHQQAEVNMKLQPVVLCGGSGTRLWPLSRERHPKQLLALNGDLSLLQETVRLAAGLTAKPAEPAAPMVISNEDYRFMIADQLRGIGVPPHSIVLEPEPKGTAPALTLAALHALSDNDAVLVVMPSDHAISRPDAFHEAIRRGAALAAEGCIVAFGIPPASAETRYGYIRVGNEMYAGRNPPAYSIDSFVEKPDAETAQRYFSERSHLWNSGIFMVRASVWIEVIGRLRPEILEACRAAHAQGVRDGNFYRVDAVAFEKCPADTIDYAVMERIGLQRGKAGGGVGAVAVKLDANWSDIGTWDALWDIGAKDGGGNVKQGDVCAVETRQSLLISNHRLLACVGVEDVVVIETPDAVMVARRDRAQEVRKVVARLKSESRQECLTHRKVHRPWGSYDDVDQGERFRVKRIIVNPGEALSLQIHYHRAEHWIVVRGTARVTRGEQTYLLTENQSTYIPLGMKHRLANPGRVPLEIVEVQSGAYLAEDDIVRLEDTYGRLEKNGARETIAAPASASSRKAAAEVGA